MSRLTWFLSLLVALGGCPAGPRYLIADVVAHEAPLEGALVAAECGKLSRAALRTDDRGRARVSMRGAEAGASCTVTVAAPHHATVAVPAAGTCTAPLACPPIVVDVTAPLRPPGLEVAK